MLTTSGDNDEPFRERMRQMRAEGQGYRSWNVRLTLALTLVMLAAGFAVWRLTQGDLGGAVFGLIVVVAELVIAIQLAVLIKRRRRSH